MPGDLYRELGVDRSASDKDIQSAYRNLAKEFHPDANSGDARAEERFKSISAAYKILKDPQSRSRYDRGEIDENGQEMGMRFNRGHPGAGGRGGDPGGAGFGGFDDIINDLFGGRGQGRTARPKGRDLRSNLSVSFIEAAAGVTKRMSMPDGRTVEVNVPAGIETGKTLRLRRQGENGPAGNGDLLVEITVEPHPNFKRDGLDISIDHFLPLSVAILGGKARVETIHGDVNLTVPPWCSSGKTMRLRGKGIQAPGGNGKGDQLVRFLVELPKEPDPALESLMREMEMAQE